MITTVFGGDREMEQATNQLVLRYGCHAKSQWEGQNLHWPY